MGLYAHLKFGGRALDWSRLEASVFPVMPGAASAPPGGTAAGEEMTAAPAAQATRLRAAQRRIATSPKAEHLGIAVRTEPRRPRL